MKTLLSLILICLMSSTCKKAEHASKTTGMMSCRMQLLDTLSGKPIPYCRTVLVRNTEGHRQIIREDHSDSMGWVEFDSVDATMSLEFLHNDYAWHEPASIESTVHHLSPYVDVQLHYDNPDHTKKQVLNGGFNEAPLYLIQLSGDISITAEVFKNLNLAYTRCDDTVCDTSRYEFWIDRNNLNFNLP